MLDIKFIRENLEVVKDGARKKHAKIDFDKLIELDDRRLVLLREIEKMRAEQNTASRQIQSSADEDFKTKAIEEMRELKENLKEKDGEYKKVFEKWYKIMLQIPNIPDMTVPEGVSDEDNVEIKTWGEKPQFNFEPKDHIEIMKKLDLVDFERGAKVHGFRGYFLKNDAVRLSFAIWNYAMDFFSGKDLSPIIAPAIVKHDHFFGTGHLPMDKEDLYETQDGDNLAGTSEVSVMGYYSDEILDIADLPIKKLAFSPCYRREAGSYGKDVKGLIRVNEFYKWEQLILCEAKHEESVKHHEELLKNAEEFIQSLDIPYRVVNACGGDLGLGHVKMYDIELWVPLENKYREIGSTSYYNDFQTRRFKIKYKDRDGKIRFAHSLNSTAIPTPRILVSLVENFQQEDGSIKIPEVLQKYMDKPHFAKATRGKSVIE